MVLAIDVVGKKRKLLEESYVLIERLKKVRALNADPRILGIDPCIGRVDSSFKIFRSKRG